MLGTARHVFFLTSRQFGNVISSHYIDFCFNVTTVHSAITSSKLKKEALEQGKKYVES